MTDLHPVRGDRYVWNDEVIVEVRRVAADGTWADIICADGLTIWRKRQPLPLSTSFRLLEAS